MFVMCREMREIASRSALNQSFKVEDVLLGSGVFFLKCGVLFFLVICLCVVFVPAPPLPLSPEGDDTVNSADDGTSSIEELNLTELNTQPDSQ